MDDGGDMSLQTTTLGAGCFWCVEAVYQNLAGVQNSVSGYMGGPSDNPNYRDVCGGQTGHAEVLQLQFDPSAISFAELLHVFWRTHDPTTLNCQGNDQGTQYRSAIFFHDHEHDHDHKKSKRGTWNVALDTYKEDFDTVKSVFDSYVTPADEIEDLNRRGAYMHVLADALVSVLILIALILGMLFPKLTILDPLIGVIGGVIIARWALSLITESKNQLLGID